MAMERSAGGVIFHGGLYLLLKYGWGHWGFVKGNIEKGETEEEAFFREAEEEAGLPRNTLKIIDGFKEKISYFYKKKEKQYLRKSFIFWWRVFPWMLGYLMNIQIMHGLNMRMQLVKSLMMEIKKF